MSWYVSEGAFTGVLSLPPWKWWSIISYLEPSTELLPEVQFDLTPLLHIDQMSPVL